MACPFADLRRAPHCARPEPLDSRALIGVHGLDVEVLADELVIVLSVRDRRLEQLAPIARDRPRRKSQDSSRLVNRLAADVVTHQARLARRRADVLGLRPDDRRRQIGIAPAPSPPRCSLRRLLRLGLSGLAPRTPPTPLRSSRGPTLTLGLPFVLVILVLVLGLLVLVVGFGASSSSSSSDSSSSSSASGSGASSADGASVSAASAAVSSSDCAEAAVEVASSAETGRESSASAAAEGSSERPVSDVGASSCGASGFSDSGLIASYQYLRDPDTDVSAQTPQACVPPLTRK